MDSISSPWPNTEPSFNSSFSSDDSFYSVATAFDRRLSAASCSDSWDPSLSTGSSSVLTPSSLPSTPTHDEAGTNRYPFCRPYPHMMSLTPDTKQNHSFFLEHSPMIHQDSPLSRYHMGPFPGEVSTAIATPSPFGSQTYDSTPMSTHLMSRNLRLAMSTQSSDDQITQDIQMYRSRPSREDSLIPSYLYTPTVKSDPWSQEMWNLSKQTNAQRLSQLTHAACNTVTPASTIVSPTAGISFLSGSTEDAFGSPTDRHDDDDDIFTSSPVSDLDTLWNPSPVKQTRKYTKTRRATTSTKKKQMTKVGPGEYHGSLRGNTFSIDAIHVPRKTHECDRADCTRSFSRKEHLKRHMKVHAPGFLHSCALPDSICQKKFGRTDNRMQHYATHLKTKRGQAERNKIVDFNELCRWIRKQEDLEVAEKTIAKLAKKRRQQETEDRTEFMNMNSRHIKGKKD